MSRASAHASAVCTPRILNRDAVKRLLNRFRLPRYDVLASYLEDYGHRVRPWNLWKAVFDEELPTVRDAFTMECEFVGRVHREMFPLDLDYMDSLYGSGEDPLNFGIPIQGYGLPWEIVSFGDLAPGAKPVLATLGLFYQFDLADSVEEGFYNRLDVWWDDVGRRAPACRLDAGVGGLERFREALQCLGEPFDGLDVVVMVLLKETGNMFLDAVSTFWQEEYDEYFDMYCWCPECIGVLAEQFSLVRPEVKRLERYYDWWQETPDAQDQVLDVLERVVSGRWEIRDGELIEWSDNDAV